MERPQYLLPLWNSGDRWYNKKGEVNEALKAFRFSNRSKSWVIAKQYCFAIVVCARKRITVGKKKHDLMKCWDTCTPRRTTYQVEQAWFEGLWEEDVNSMERLVGKLQEITPLQELWKVILYICNYWTVCFQVSEYFKKKKPCLYSS